MKCEICHKNDAETALERGEDELYVCRACAASERARRQQKSQRTRKISRGGLEMSVTEVSGDLESAPPIVKAIMNAFEGMVSDVEKAAEESKKEVREEFHDFPTERAEAAYRLAGGLHLEGLHLIGELEAVHRAFRALKLELVGIDADGIRETGHVYHVRYAGSLERAKRIVEDLLEQERNARVRLFEEMPRVFGDSLCRALAILKNARLLSPAELFDLLSPLRLAALEQMLDGITLKEVEALLAKQDLTSGEDGLDANARDKADADRADAANARFEDVILNERGEEKFL